MDLLSPSLKGLPPPTLLTFKDCFRNRKREKRMPKRSEKVAKILHKRKMSQVSKLGGDVYVMWSKPIFRIACTYISVIAFMNIYVYIYFCMHVYTEFIPHVYRYRYAHINTDVYIWILWPQNRFITHMSMYMMIYSYICTYYVHICSWVHTHIHMCFSVLTHTLNVHGSEPVNLYPLLQRVPEMTQD